MKRAVIWGFLVLLAYDVAAQLCFKFAANTAAPFEMTTAWLLRIAGAPWIYGSLACYFGALITWLTLLKHVPVGPAFAASHLDIVVLVLICVPMFGETVGVAQLLGCASIVLGVLCLSAESAQRATSNADLLLSG